MSAVEKARAAWGDEIPDWVLAMAEHAEATSQNKVAQRIGRTAPLVSQVLGNKYGAGLDQIEELVRSILMREMVNCPGKGREMAKVECSAWRTKSRSFSGHNPERVFMFRACRRCPVNQVEAKS